MDGAAAFLHRRERRAIARHRKGEPLRAIAPVTGQVQGVLAVTPTRLLLARRGWLGVKVDRWRRRDLVATAFDRVRYGALRFSLRNGHRIVLAFTSRQDAQAVETAMLHGHRPASTAAPVAFRVRGPSSSAAPDPLAHRGTAKHEATLRRLHAQGVLTKAELEWQLDA